MAELQINLLGPPEIRWEGSLLNVNRRVPRTILLYLASQGNYVGRRRLLTLFWEDTPTKAARRRLREALSRIRAELPDPSILTSNSDLIGLDQTKSSVDQIKFLKLVESVGNQPWIIPQDNQLPENILQTMINATRLWHGSQFLEGADVPSTHSIEDWLSQTNQQLTHLRTRFLLRLSDHSRASGQYEDALKYSYQAIESDNLNEDIHYRILRLLVDMEQYQEARQYYSYVTKLFSEELDSHPSLQLISVYRQIQKETLTSIKSSQPDWRVLATIHTPFVGRQAELTQLHETLTHGGGMIVSGESGLGKTRLIQEFCELFASDRRIFVTPCRPAETNLPFQPIIEILRNQIHPTEWGAIQEIWAEPLTIILPELLSLHPSLNPPGTPYDLDQYRSTLFEAIRQVFMYIAQKKDLVIFLDDAQWADEATLSTVAYLIDRPPFDRNALAILATRSEEINPSLEKFISSYHFSPKLRLVGLGHLDIHEISSLGRYVLGYPLNTELLEQLEYETGGNPFIILETLRTFQEMETRSVSSTQSRLPLARSVYSLIQNRINRLSPQARETCEFAAVIGPEFDPELVGLASQQNMMVISRAIEELNQRKLIETIYRTPQDISCRFIHDKIRETLMLETNPIRLRFLHEQIALAIESSLDSELGSQAAVLANHFESAGKLVEAIKYWLQAGQWARQLLSTAEAQKLFSHAEQLIYHANAYLTDELIHDLYAEWTEMAYETHDVKAIEEQNHNLLTIGRDRKSPLLIGTALDGLSDACLAKNQFAEGLSFTNQAIKYLDQTDNVFEKMDAQIHRGVFLYMLGRFHEAIQPFELALKLGDDANNPGIQRAMANGYYQLALTYTLSGWPEAGQKNATRSLELANNIGHPHIATTAYTASSLTRYFMADYQEARHDNTQGIEIAKRIHADRMLGYLYAIQGFLDVASGDLGSAYDSAQLVSELGKEHGYDDIQSIGYRLVGDIFLLLEAPSKACEYFQNGVDFGSKDFWGLDNLIRLGYAQIRDGQTEIGMHNLQSGIDQAKSGGLGIIEILGNQFLCYANTYLGDWEQVQQIAYPLERQARKRSMPLVQVMSQVTQGILESILGKIYNSIDQLQLTVDMISEIEYPVIELRTLIRLIQAKQLCGQETNTQIQRVNEILDCLEQNAHPEEISQAVFEFRQKMLNPISP